MQQGFGGGGINRGGGGGKRGGKTPPSKLVDSPKKDPKRYYFSVSSDKFGTMNVDADEKETLSDVKENLKNKIQTQLALAGNYYFKMKNGDLVLAENTAFEELFPNVDRSKRICIVMCWTGEGAPGPQDGYLGYPEDPTKPGPSKPGPSKPDTSKPGPKKPATSK